MYRWLIVALLWAATPASAEASSPPLPVQRQTQGHLPDSIRLRMLAMIAEGNIAGAVEYYVLATGQTAAPRWLTAMQGAFNVANRVAGPCKQVADDIYEGFKQLGQNPQLIRFVTKSADGPAGRIGFDLGNGRWAQVSTNGLHLAVRVGDKIYDAFTGPTGLAVAEYVSRLQPGMRNFPITMQ